MAVYSCRDEELPVFEEECAKRGAEFVYTQHMPTLDNVPLASGCGAVSVITTPVEAPLIDAFQKLGVRVISTRTVGYEHVDFAHAASVGVAVCNVGYTPHTVAEYTVMCMLMAIRKVKIILTRYQVNDFSLPGSMGREVSRMTVGVVGTGRIGETVVRLLSGFGCRILAYDLHEKDSVKAYAAYVPLEDIWRECDAVTFHTPATPETHHLVNASTLAQMKDGVVLVNTARGSIIEMEAFVAALESGKVGAAALDVLEGEGPVYYRDFRSEVVKLPYRAYLNSMPNVLMLPHTAFYTYEAMRDMVTLSVDSCAALLRGESTPWRVN